MERGVKGVCGDRRWPVGLWRALDLLSQKLFAKDRHKPTGHCSNAQKRTVSGADLSANSAMGGGLHCYGWNAKVVRGVLTEPDARPMLAWAGPQGAADSPSLPVAAGGGVYCNDWHEKVVHWKAKLVRGRLRIRRSMRAGAGPQGAAHRRGRVAATGGIRMRQ